MPPQTPVSSKGKAPSSTQDTTPSSRLIILSNSLNDKAKKRVRDADPNNNRCLVENCAEERAVEFAHVCPKWFANDVKTMDNIEWHWKMAYKTLNLDTRWNIMRLGSSVHRLFDKSSWVLIPEQRIVDQYYRALTFSNEEFVTTRAKFPEIENRDDFEYTVIPINYKVMSRIALFRQNVPLNYDTLNDPPNLTANDFVIHTYPFRTIPILKSHVHPKFVILETGLVIAGLKPDVLFARFAEYPMLQKINRIYEAWTANRPDNWGKDKTYNVSKPDDGRGSDADSEYTEKSRTKPQKRPRQDDPETPTPGPVTRSQRASGSGAQGKQRALKREPSLCLSKKSLEIHDSVIGTGDQWTHVAVEEWSGKCRPLPETEHTPWAQFPTGVCV